MIKFVVYLDNEGIFFDCSGVLDFSNKFKAWIKDKEGTFSVYRMKGLNHTRCFEYDRMVPCEMNKRGFKDSMKWDGGITIRQFRNFSSRILG